MDKGELRGVMKKIGDKEWDVLYKSVSFISNHYGMEETVQRELYNIVINLPKKAEVLELGVCNGRTGIILMHAASKIDGFYTGIDNWSLENSYENVDNDFVKFGLQYKLIKSKTQAVNWNKEVDFLFIDAGHDEVNVRGDVLKYIPYVRDGGIVFFDDYDSVYQKDSAHWAVRYYADQHTGSWKVLERNNTNAIKPGMLRQKIDINTKYKFNLQKP